MKKLKIGLFIDTYFPMVDGVIMVVDNYARRLAKIADVTVFAPRVPKKDYDDSQLPYKVVRCKSIPLSFVDYALPLPGFDKGFKKQLKEADLDIVHIHSPATIGKMALNYAKKHNIPVIATMHSQYKQDFQRAVKMNWLASFMTKKLMKFFDSCTECWAVNDEIARIFYEEYGYKELPKVMNNATDMMPIENIEISNKEIDDMYGIKENERVFLFVGRLNILKNILFIVDSLKIVKEDGINFKMLFVGNGQDEEALRERIKENGLDNEVVLCGRVMDRELIAKIYARAELFLFPSLYDASSLVQVEAASQKTPTIFIEGSATSATVQNNVNGIIAPNSTIEYAKAIEKMMSDKDFYNKISEGAFRDLYKNWDSVVSEVFKNYNDYCKTNS